MSRTRAGRPDRWRRRGTGGKPHHAGQCRQACRGSHEAEQTALWRRRRGDRFASRGPRLAWPKRRRSIRQLERALELIASARARPGGGGAYAGQLCPADRGRSRAARANRNRLQELTALSASTAAVSRRAVETLDRSRAEIAELEASERAAPKPKRSSRKRARPSLAARARAQHAAARKRGAELKRRMEAELKTLEMRNAVFEARFGNANDGEAAFTRDGVTLGPSGYRRRRVLSLAQPGSARRCRSARSLRVASSRG